MQSAARVGVLVVVFIGLLVGGYAVLGRNIFEQSRDRYDATFADAAGIAPGARVLLAGVQVGEVEKVNLATAADGSVGARLTLSLKGGTPVPAGSTVVIPGSLIGLGDTPVSILPSGATALAKPGDTLAGIKASPLDGILPNSKETIEELTATIAAARRLMEDPELAGGVKKMMASTTKTVESMDRLLQSVNSTLVQNQGTLEKTLLTASNAVSDMQRTTSAVAKLMESGKLQNGATAMIDQLNATAKKADQLVASMNELLNDPKLREPMATTMQNVADITTTGKEIAGNTATMTKNGAVVSEKAIGLIEKVDTIATKAIEIEEQLQGLLKKVGGVFDKSPNAKSFEVQSEMSLTRETDPAYWRTDTMFSVPLRDSRLHFGLYDTFEGNKLTVQYERPITSSLDYRFGVFASKPGVGVDFSAAQRLGLRADLWDINRPRLDLRARYHFGNGLSGWIGLDRVFKDNAPTIGIGIRK